jgi:hypothetical protein
VSASIAHLFSQHAASYQALAGQAAAFQQQFVQHLTASAGAYASAEDAIAAFLQDFPIWADFLSASATGLFTFLATTPPELPLLFLFSILLVAILSALLFVTVPPLLAVVLPLVFVVVLPLGIAGLASIFGPTILLVLLGQLESVLSPAGLAAAELFPALASFGI